MMEDYTMQNPTIKEIVTTIRIPDIAKNFSLKEMPEKVEKRLNIWAHKARIKYNYDDDILMAVLLLAMRTKKDHDIPNANYLNKILENFKKFNVTTLDDAIGQYYARIKFELEKLTTAKEAKKYYSKKQMLNKVKIKGI